MASFLTSPEICGGGGQTSFFSHGNYAASSFSRSWGTALTPDTEGAGFAKPVYLQVLDTYGIPYDDSNGLPPGGYLPGIDIKRMNAIDAIRLSMAEALTVGQWWEVYEDGEGGVYFQNVFDNGSPAKVIALDVRQCVPSVTKNNEVDMVIVRGYDSPPEIYSGDFKDVVPGRPGPVNPESITGNEDVFTIDLYKMLNDAGSGCHGTHLLQEAVKSYADPLISDIAFGTQVNNPFYNIKAHEKILTWAVKITGLPDSLTNPEEAAKYQYSFEDTTTWYYPQTFPHFSKKTTEDALSAAVKCTSGLQYSNTIAFYAGSFEFDGLLYTDKYGYKWPLVIRPAKLLYTGYKVDAIVTFGSGNDATNFVMVNPIKELVSLDEGSQWTFTVEGLNKFGVNMYYQPKLDPILWDFVLSVTQDGAEGTVDLRVSDGSSEYVITKANSLPNSTPGVGFLPGPNSFGFYVTDFWVGLQLERPCVRLTAIGAPARPYLDTMRIQYAPIIEQDLPVPIAYKHKTEGLHVITADDVAASLPDNDPTTCQNFDNSPLEVLQELAQGNVIDVTLPFCENTTVCAKVAETIFDYQNNLNVHTVTLSCGPNDEPELGAAVSGFSTELRIESINYSYTDGSAYTIEVTLGPIFANVGSFQNGAWTRKRSDIPDRDAFIIWSAGDGINYRVMVQGLGTFMAFNGVQDPNAIWRVGERVKVAIKNAPIEE